MSWGSNRGLHSKQETKFWENDKRNRTRDILLLFPETNHPANLTFTFRTGYLYIVLHQKKKIPNIFLRKVCSSACTHKLSEECKDQTKTWCNAIEYHGESAYMLPFQLLDGLKYDYAVVPSVHVTVWYRMYVMGKHGILRGKYDWVGAKCSSVCG